MIDFFEHVEIGRRVNLGAHRFTAEEIQRYATRFDPHRFHLEQSAAECTPFGNLCASGWHTAAVCARLMALAYRRQAEALRGAGRPVPRLGPSPGFRELRWLRPVHAGDVIAFSSEVVDKRAAGPPGFGTVAVRNVGTNQRGEVAISFLADITVEMRVPAVAPVAGGSGA